MQKKKLICKRQGRFVKSYKFPAGMGMNGGDFEHLRGIKCKPKMVDLEVLLLHTKLQTHLT